MSFTWFAPRPLHTRVEWGQTFLRVIRDLGITDERGAFTCTAMCAFQEAGAAAPGGGPRQIWTPGNPKDPCYKANPGAYPHDSESNDGYSSGPFQQQMSGPGVTPAWGWGGLWGDPEGTRKRMDAYESTKLFVTALKRSGFNAATASTANDSVQRVQKSGVPTAYAQWFNEAQKLYTETLSGNPSPPVEEPVTDPNRPDFNEFPLFLSGNSEPRNTADVDLWLLHTQEPPRGSDNRNDAALELRNFLESTKGSGNPVSYHYSGSMANDGGTTVVDCVDTDEACWAVGNSNDRSINFCFAGSRSDWTRQEWIDNELGTILAAAYLFVQDCAKYPKLKARVIAPNYSAPPGAADHNYCTVFLKDGNNHTDVGPNFPWDVFTAAVTKYANPSAPPVTQPPVTQPPVGDPFTDMLNNGTDRQVLNWIAAQLGPGDPSWPSKGSTLRDKLWSLVPVAKAVRKSASK